MDIKDRILFSLPIISFSKDLIGISYPNIRTKGYNYYPSTYKTYNYYFHRYLLVYSVSKVKDIKVYTYL